MSDLSETATPRPMPRNLQLHLGLFVATVLSVFVTGALYETANAPDRPELEGLGDAFLYGLTHAHEGWRFAVPLIAILLTHELGHYFAALYHRVPASLPYFIPLPVVSPFGTMGAVISMPSRIKSRNALLDIGAAGPLAGMVVAIPVLIIGLSQSQVEVFEAPGALEGQCLLYSGLKYLVHGPIPDGHDVVLTSTAFAGWTGLLVTMLNMLPIGQLDGGHIAYALFEKKQNIYGRYVHFGLLGVFVYNLAFYQEIAPGFVWVMWFGLLHLLRRLSGGIYHPPTDPGSTLSPGRRIVAVFSLVLFVLLFMPTPWRLVME